MLQLSSIPPGICDLAITRINGKSTNPRRLVHSWIRFTTHRASNLTNRLSRNCSGKDFVPSSLFSVFKLTKLNHFLPKTNQLLWGACWQHYLARQEVVNLPYRSNSGEKKIQQRIELRTSQIGHSWDPEIPKVIFTLTEMYYILQEKMFTVDKFSNIDTFIKKYTKIVANCSTFVWKSCSKFCSCGWW